ncbi:hypothetical protein FHG66_07715 [Rubellimicrobium rubrum]|uniref:HlyD family efflux transporter periplasmic adaptor subunit n=1 Tax=Rubellimicrobium rubrum TaxID=2585369 RepID=A0A5C4N2Z3_9RHOB|nr:hypothetical protein [Rubellimicrobium rubrum]TNC50848.1 hypothetical protein FHG66_07715 [Rubellimicrobium rubrum]
MTMRPDPPLRQDTLGTSSLPAGLGGNEHPLIDIPFTVYVDGRQYTGAGISLVEAHVVGLADPALENQKRLVRIAFDFGGFAVSLHPEVWIVRDSPQSLVLRFIDPTGEHLPQLRHILNDYISGDITSLGTVIRAGTLTSPKAAGRPTVRRSPWAGLKTVLGTILALVLMLVLLTVAATLVGRRVLLTDLPAPAQIAIAGETLRAVADGQITYLDPEAPQGEVAYAVASTSGETLSIAMPCDCRSVTVGIAEGSTVLAGEPVLRLTQGEPVTIVEANVPRQDLFALQQAGGAEIRLSDGRTVFGQLDSRTSAVDLAPGEDLVPVRLMPEAPLSTDLAGQAVALRIRRDAGNLLAPVAEGWADARAFLTSLWAGARQP